MRYYFSVPIYETVVDTESNSIQSEIVKFIQKNKYSFRTSWGDPVYTTFNEFKNVIQDIPSLYHILLTHVKNYLNESDIPFGDIDIFESWVNVTRYNGYQKYHIHYLDECFISGVYYFQTNGNDGDIVFNFLEDESTISFQPEIGKIILFPSSTRHKVTKNTSGSDRISIAFNCKIL